MSRSIEINISPKYQYEPIYTRQARYIDLWGGRGRGGSHEATLYALMRLTSPTYYRIAFLRKILKDVRDSLWADFKDRITECGLPLSDFDIADHEMRCTYIPTGNTIVCKGVKADGSRTAKLKSLAGFNLIIMEECDELLEEEFDTIDDSLRTIKGPPPQIVRVFNPPGRLHWIWKDYNLVESEIKGYWKAYPKAEATNLVSVFSTFKDNLTNLAQTSIEKNRNYEIKNPDYYYTMICGLISEGQRGRIYSGWTPITQEVFKSIDSKSIFVLDFGWSDSPMALAEFKFKKDSVYGREHIYAPMTLKELAIQLCTLGLTDKDLIIADSEDPASINKLRTGWEESELSDQEIQLYPQLTKGFYILGALKGPGSINFGISKVKEMKVFICEDSKNFWNEYRNYKWALDVNKNPTNAPEDANNHLMDDLRYAVHARGRFFDA